MINILYDYIRNSLPGDWFSTNGHLTDKVAEDGKLLPFFGNTVVYTLDDNTKKHLFQLQERLYYAAPGMLAAHLDERTFHMTVHDLVNGREDTPSLRRTMAETEMAARVVLSTHAPTAPLKMHATCTFNMVNTSIVLGLAPSDEASHWALDRLYMGLEQVRPLGYALTPHITLAYFRPGIYSWDNLNRLRKALGPVELDITLRPETLELDTFRDMNHYISMC